MTGSPTLQRYLCLVIQRSPSSTQPSDTQAKTPVYRSARWPIIVVGASPRPGSQVVRVAHGVGCHRALGNLNPALRIALGRRRLAAGNGQSQPERTHDAQPPSGRDGVYDA